MNDSAFRRAVRPQEPPKAVHTAIRASDDPATRAARILEHAGITDGDPAILARHAVRVAEMVAQYMEIDEEARRR